MCESGGSHLSIDSESYILVDDGLGLRFVFNQLNSTLHKLIVKSALPFYSLDSYVFLAPNQLSTKRQGYLKRNEGKNICFHKYCFRRHTRLVILCRPFEFPILSSSFLRFLSSFIDWKELIWLDRIGHRTIGNLCKISNCHELVRHRTANASLSHTRLSKVILMRYNVNA